MREPRPNPGWLRGFSLGTCRGMWKDDAWYDLDETRFMDLADV